MGLLSKGTPLPWDEAKKYADHVRKHGIQQFLAIYRKLKDRQNDGLLWGDEIEYTLVRFDDEGRDVKLDLSGLEIVGKFMEEEDKGVKTDSLWRPEFARYMLEGTPAEPYGSELKDFLVVETNMRARRKLVEARLTREQQLLSVTTFPLLGAKNFLYPHHDPVGEASHSLFIPDEAINTHPRFATLTRNIRERRGRKVCMNVPVYRDVNTPNPFVEKYPQSKFPEGPDGALPDHIYLDCMCFGMGCSCLQVTLQACNIDEARKLYDQLTPLAPLMLAISAGAPIWRGYLADTDVRWRIISGSVDDRTKEEMGLEPLANNRFQIPKSRYDSVDRYISNDPRLLPQYNDLKEVYDKDIFETLTKEGIDPLLAHHVSHLFVRDPLVIYKELLDQNDEESSDHFENIQSTNWQTIRFKPPPPHSPIGWRVEFRSMEVQLTEYENAAYAIFIVLLTRTILSLDISLYMPLSKVDENMATAHKRDAAKNETFYFRKYILEQSTVPTDEDPNACVPMTLDTIFNGKAGEFPGLIPLMRSYLDSMQVDFETRCALGRYLDLISGRASGKLMTPAAWMRNFVMNHPEYKQDSVVSNGIAYDLMKACEEITHGTRSAPEFLGRAKINP